MSKSIWVSLGSLKEHEFRCTLRHLKATGLTWSEIYLRLGEIEKVLLASAAKTGSPLVVGLLILNSLAKDGLASITLFGYTASVPLAYLVALLAINYHFLLLYLNSILSIILIRSKEANRIKLSRFSAQAYGLYKGQDQMALVIPIVVTNFLNDRFRILSIMEFATIFIILILAMPLAGYAGFLLSWQYDLAFVSPRSFVEGFTALLALVATSIAIIFAILFRIPIPMRKDSFGIRWGFLSRLYPLGGHPRIREWIAEEGQWGSKN